ncbi:MAG: hypothetical protein Q8S18_08575 [Bacteroidales bacterium]|nr:hypothetical protein [Bacteroidales bacterium]
MKNRSCIRMLVLTSLFSLFVTASMAQKGEWQLGTDVYNRYIWWGMDFGNSPSIQPSLSYTNSGFTFGAWGAYATNFDYQETDLYVSYDIKEVVTLMVTDYFFPGGGVGNNAYFKYDEDVTGHVFEGSVIFNGMDKIPFSLSLNYNFYGADADNSFYAELGYGGEAKDVEYNVFIGATTGKGIYLPNGSDNFSVVNLGLSLSKAVTVTEAFSLPITASVITNPQAQNIFFVVGFSF